MADSQYQYIDTTGVIVPDTEDTLGVVDAEYKEVFGNDLITTPDTPQGVLISAETAARNAVIENNAALANQINPNIAGGVFLDAIMALTGIQRQPQTPSRIPSVALTGVAGSILPQGVQARSVNGDLFQSVAAVTLDGTGNGVVDFIAVEYGPIPCPAHDLTQIVTGILGWETVDNPTAATLGTTTQSDQVARAYRQNTMAFQGVALAEAITSALYATTGVKSLQFRENVAHTTQTIDGISMVSHSIYVCVDGGTDLDVASALLENKSSGAAWNGDTEVDVVEPASGQTYAVKFDRPTTVGILVRVTIKNGTEPNVVQAILDYANGLIDGQPGFTVGSPVSPFELSGAINREFPAIYVQKVEISLTDPIDFTTDEIPIAINEVAHTQESYITVIIN